MKVLTIKKIIMLVFSIAMVFAGVSCKEDEPKGILTNSKVFDVGRFRQNLQNGLNGAIGYSFVISRYGKLADSASFGVGSVDPAAGTAIRPSIYHDINIASVNKTFTAMAALGLLKERGQLLNFPIGQW